MDDVVNPDGGKFRLGEPEHLLPPLVERDDAQVQLVLRLEHHLGERVRIGRGRVVHWVEKVTWWEKKWEKVTWWEKKEEFTSFWGISSRLGGPKGVQMQKRARGGSSVFRF